MALLKPNYILKKITDITPEFLDEHNIKGLLLDVDNTLAPHGKKEPDSVAGKWIKDMLAAGVKLRIISNAKNSRIKVFADKVSLPFSALSLKPLPFKIQGAVRLTGFAKKETAIVGDQIFTDILGGNLAGIKTVLTEPIKPENGWFFRVKRRFETKLIRRWKS